MNSNKSKKYLRCSALAAGFFMLSAVACHAQVSDENRASAGYVEIQSGAASRLEQENRAKDFIQSMGDEVIRSISDPSLSNAQEKDKLRAVLTRNFDMYTISRFTLGTYWKDLTPEQQGEYRTLFEDMIVSIYADTFSRYQGEDFKVSSVRSTGSSDLTVLSYIIPKTGENIPVSWRLRFKNDEYKIIDVAIKDVSQIITQRSDFASTIQRGGGNAAVILDYLRSRARKNT